MHAKVWIRMAVIAGVLVMAGCGKKQETPSAQAPPSVEPTANVKVADVATYGKGPRAKICPVSHEKIGGDMGKPYVYTMEDGRKITLCCPMCKPAVRKDPAKYAAFFY